MPPIDAEEWGALVGVRAFHALPTDTRSPDSRYDEYQFGFERGALVVTAVPEDDTVTISLANPTLTHATDLTTQHPWRMLIGCALVWQWDLTNQHGYLDGCQLEFARPGQCWTLQLICEAGSLTAHALTPIDSLWNQFANHPPDGHE